MAVVDDVRPAAEPLTRRWSSRGVHSVQHDASPADANETRFTRAPASSGRNLAGYAALVLAFVACPCHLPLTLGLVAAAVGGTAATAAITENMGLFLAVGAVLFAGALGAGWWLLLDRTT